MDHLILAETSKKGLLVYLSITQGIAARLLYLMCLYFGGVYDTIYSVGGDVRLIKDTCISINPYVIGRYLLRAPFGSEGWIISINSMEYLVSGIIRLEQQY